MHNSFSELDINALFWLNHCSNSNERCLECHSVLLGIVVEKLDMLSLITINEHSKIPKYRQIINSVLTAIENGEIGLNDKLPSVNQILIEFDISRDTIVHAYDELKRRKIIESVPGKGYYIKNDRLALKAKVFLLFNKLSAHKKSIYDAFSKTLGDNATIDFFIYDNNYRHFKQLILSSKSRDYSHYVIIPHFDEGGDDVVDFIQEHIPLKISNS